MINTESIELQRGIKHNNEDETSSINQFSHDDDGVLFQSK